MFISDAYQWAEQLFGGALLGDARRTKRLVALTGDLAKQGGNSLLEACRNPASIEGGYRLIRNKAITPEAIAEAGFTYTDSLVAKQPLVLALQDTTGLSYRHSVCDELGSVNSASDEKKNPKGRTLYVHSTLMVDAQREQILGLANQHYWHREHKLTGKSHQLQSRPRQEKESYKWQRNIEQLVARLGTLNNVLDVCDREADFYEYLEYQVSHGHRFVVRADENRCLAEPGLKLLEVLDELPPVDTYEITLRQKGGRKGKVAAIELSYTQVSLQKPQRAKGEKTLDINVVQCREINELGHYGKLRWVLYTTEPVNSAQDARRLARYYELRWRIEEFHKTWKSDGTQVESLRMRTRENLRRLAVIQAFVAVRLLQLRDIVQNREEAKTIPCTVHFSELSWKLLWKGTSTNKVLPKEPPSLYWAYYAMANLGGWHDRTRSGRVGVTALWNGWKKLSELVESYEFFRGLDL